jgi:hypothetical protein
VSRRAALAATHAMLTRRIEANVRHASQAEELGARSARDRAKARAQAYRDALYEFEGILAEHVK